MIRKELMCNFIFYYLEPLKDQDQPFSKVEIVLQNSENFNKKCQWNGSENIMTIDLVTIFEQKFINILFSKSSPKHFWGWAIIIKNFNARDYNTDEIWTGLKNGEKIHLSHIITITAAVLPSTFIYHRSWLEDWVLWFLFILISDSQSPALVLQEKL